MAVPAAAWNLVIEQGATWTLVLILDEWDLTGCTARMQVRKCVESSETLLDLHEGHGITVEPGPPGKISLQLSAEETAALDWRHGVYDLEVVNLLQPHVERLLKGQVTVDAEVTR